MGMKVQSSAFLTFLLHTDVYPLIYEDKDCVFKNEDDENAFLRLLTTFLPYHTLDQLGFIEQMFKNQWVKPLSEDYPLDSFPCDHIFNAMLRYANDVIDFKNGEPICKDSKLLNWQMTSSITGEDIFISLLLAAKKCHAHQQCSTSSFLWPAYINHNAEWIKNVTKKALTDLHTHLNGSSLNFDISWLCLMNHIKDVADKMKAWHIHQMPSISYLDSTHNRLEIYQLAILAAAIRVYLYDVVHDQTSFINLQDIRSTSITEDFTVLLEHLQSNIDDKMASGCFRFQNKCIDYACQNQGIDVITSDSKLMIPLSGERKFMYDVFSYLLANNTDQILLNLFLAYLIIKIIVRGEMAQNNLIRGLKNFQCYDTRKDELFNDRIEYKSLMWKLAIDSHFVGNEHGYLETRFKPKGCSKDLINKVQDIDRAVKNKELEFVLKGNSYFFVPHFIKEEDQKPISESACRHYDLRGLLWKQAHAIKSVITSADVNVNSRIVGVDAANSEVVCRPEVFARVFRFLGTPFSCLDDSGRQKTVTLGRTFHVGEDFLSIVDGLRAIDEVLIYMNFKEGDRLGHALALGIDIAQYYKELDYRLPMTIEMLLDNLAWMYHYMNKDLHKELAQKMRILFESTIEQCYSEIIDIEQYYKAWLLRGDDPETDRTIMIDSSFASSIIPDLYLLNVQNECKEARKDPVAIKLYYRYHFDKKVREHTSKIFDFKIEVNQRKEVQAIVKELQEMMLKKIEDLKISIECNPSSNLKIGAIHKYDEHPIWKLFSLDIASTDSHHLSVSINTDDKGVFSTSIAREYALLGLSKINDQNSNLSQENVSSWLEDIRKCGWEQRFCLKKE